MLTGGGDRDLLNGGLGDDLFVVDARQAGRMTIEDFRLSDVEQDRIRIVGSTIRSDAELRRHAEQRADGLLLHLGASDLLIEHATWGTLTPGTVSYGRRPCAGHRRGRQGREARVPR